MPSPASSVNLSAALRTRLLTVRRDARADLVAQAEHLIHELSQSREEVRKLEG